MTFPRLLLAILSLSYSNEMLAVDVPTAQATDDLEIWSSVRMGICSLQRAPT
jgi:hypothetical protein